MQDVMPKPEIDPAATKTAVVIKYFYHHDEARKAAAREVLRRIGPTKAYRGEDGMANVALEEIWNALLGNE